MKRREIAGSRRILMKIRAEPNGTFSVFYVVALNLKSERQAKIASNRFLSENPLLRGVKE